MTDRGGRLSAAFDNGRLGGIYGPALLGAAQFGPTWQMSDGTVEVVAS
jgi:hypothetical protein